MKRNHTHSANYYRDLYNNLEQGGEKSKRKEVENVKEHRWYFQMERYSGVKCLNSLHLALTNSSRTGPDSQQFSCGLGVSKITQVAFKISTNVGRGNKSYCEKNSERLIFLTTMF